VGLEFCVFDRIRIQLIGHAYRSAQVVVQTSLR